MNELNAREIKCIKEMGKFQRGYLWMPKTVEFLVGKGLAKPIPEPVGAVVLTDQGKKYLAEYTSQQEGRKK